MRNAAQHRRQDEAPQAPPPRDLAADAAALLDRAQALLPLLEAGRADVRAVDELVVLGRRLGDLAAALEDAAAGQAVVEAVGRAEYARGWDDRGAAGQQSSRPRHAGRRRYLSSVPGIPATAARAAAAGIVAAGLTGGLVAGMHEESSVSTVAAAPAPHAALHRMAPDRAAAILPSRSPFPSPRPSMAAATASPVPSAVPGPPGPASSPPPAPVPPVTVTPGPALDVQRLLDLGDSIFGQLQLSATGPGEVAWTATATDGVVLSSYAGVVVTGEPVTLGVTDGPAKGGWIYVSSGGTTIPVEVVSGLGVPALALP